MMPAMRVGERVLRGAAIAIALLGLVDPALTLPWRDRPIVSVARVAASPHEGRPLMQAALTAEAEQALQAQVVSALGREFDVRTGTATQDAAAVVLVGDGTSPASDSAIASSTAIVAAVVPAPTTTGSGVRIVRVDAPRAAHMSSRVPITVELEASRKPAAIADANASANADATRRASTIVVRSDGLELARHTHQWNADAARAAGATPRENERFAVTLYPLPLQTGLTRFTVDVREATPEIVLDSADVAVDVHDRPLRVLVMEARPSWATRFLRRALDDDRRFDVSSSTRMSRGITSASPGAPPSLATSDLDTFHIVIVGAPELLTAADVDRLRTFARERGGLVVVAADRRPEGPVLDLLPARDFSEHLLSEPQALGDGGRLWASELAIPRTLLPGTDALLHATLNDGATARGATGATGVRPIVIASALGDGAILFSGALDAWRFRDRDEAAFDRFWRDTIAARAADVPEPIDVTISPAIAAPGDPIEISVRLRTNANAAAARATTLRATLSPVASTAATPPSEATPPPVDQARASAVSSDASEPVAASATPVRLWPGARPSAYHGALNAPSGDGVYAVLVQLDGESTALPAGGRGRAMLRVARDTHGARPAWPGLQAFVEARGGVLVTADHLDTLARQLRASVRSAETRRPRHPLRSAWWILPFALCLGGEWLLRRRRGER